MSKKSQNNYPSGSRTSWKVVITYLFVIALCGALFYYIFNLRKSIENQRSNINSQHDALSWVNEFTKSVHGAQNSANLYAFTEQQKYKREFNAYRDEIKTLTDSIMQFEISEDNKLMVNEIEDLIKNLTALSTNTHHPNLKKKSSLPPYRKTPSSTCRRKKRRKVSGNV